MTDADIWSIVRMLVQIYSLSSVITCIILCTVFVSSVLLLVGS